jgi:NAD-dependent deacetylase
VHDDDFALAADLLSNARRACAFCGAGMSTESGIPDFRSPGGIWSRYDPDEFSYPRFVSSPEARRSYWRWSREFYPVLTAARPNAGHLALAALEEAGRLACVVTQNVDGLHARAGSRRVLELHGNATRVGCLSCDKEFSRAEVQEWLDGGTDEPRCDACRGILKPRTISFGQAMPERVTEEAFAEARACDVLLAVGSSLVVYPAASLVPVAHRAGASVVLVNLEPTPFDPLARVVIRGKAGDALSRIARAVCGE